MFFQLTLLACLLVGSLSADSGLKTAASSTNTRTYFVAAAPATRFQPASASQPSSLTRQLPTTNFKCADMPYSVGLYADESANCAIYHYCTGNGESFSFACGEGTFFNQKTLTCDHPQNFVCQDSKLYHSATAGIGVETGVVAPSLPSTDFTCGNVPHPFGLYADVKTDCTLFHYCAAGEKYSFACPAGTRFNQQSLICDYASNVVNCANSASYFFVNENIGKANADAVYTVSNSGSSNAVADPKAEPQGFPPGILWCKIRKTC